MSQSHFKDHPFAQYIRILGKGKTGSRSLTLDEAYRSFSMILAGEADDIQLGAFLMLLRVKEETAEELAGFVLACRESMFRPNHDLSVNLDWSSYAGKRKHHPWYLLSALLLAQRGVRIFMHGSGGHTPGRVYSESVLPKLGYAIADNWEQAEQQLNQHNFTFMPLATFCPALQTIIELRPLLGVRSPVHTLSRLLNPLAAPCSLQSVFHPSYSESHQSAASLLKQPNAMVFKGESGEAERRPEAAVETRILRAGRHFEYTWPRLLKGRQAIPKDISTKHMLAVWREQLHDEYAEAAIIGTCAFALFLINEQLDCDQALDLARQYWFERDTHSI